MSSEEEEEVEEHQDIIRPEPLLQVERYYAKMF
jgi:hypothetical protein